MAIIGESSFLYARNFVVSYYFPSFLTILHVFQKLFETFDNPSVFEAAPLSKVTHLQPPGEFHGQHHHLFLLQNQTLVTP